MKSISVYLILATTATAWGSLTRDIEYGRAGNEPLLLDAYAPSTPGPHSVAVLIHGGGWSHGDKAGSDRPGDPSDITPWLVYLTTEGCTWFSINYRFVPDHPWPAGFEDVQNAIRWVKAHAAEFHGDPNRIALFGHSAGGHLAALSAFNATRDTRVQAAVLFAASVDFPISSRPHPKIVPRLQSALHPPVGMSPEGVAVAQDPWAIDHVTRFSCPVLIVHGSADRTVPFARSLSLLTKLREAGVPHDLITVKGGPHSLIDATTIDPSYPSAVLGWLDHNFATSTNAMTAAPDLIVAADGSGDFTTVQQALDTLEADGTECDRTVLIQEGVYRENLRLNRNRVTLRGESRHRSRIESPEPGSDAGQAPAVLAITGDDCTIENLTFVHNAAGDNAALVAAGDRLRITDCHVLSSGACAIILRNPAARTYLARLNLRSRGDCFTAAGRCFLTDSMLHVLEGGGMNAICRGTSTTPAPLLVIRNVRIDGAIDWHLWSGSTPPTGLTFMLNSRLATTMAPMPLTGSEGTFFCQTHWVGHPDDEPPDNLPSTWGVPSPALFEAKWAFDGEWDPTIYPVRD